MYVAIFIFEIALRHNILRISKIRTQYLKYILQNKNCAVSISAKNDGNVILVEDCFSCLCENETMFYSVTFIEVYDGKSSGAAGTWF